MKNRRFFLDVDAKSKGASEFWGEYEYSVQKGIEEGTWNFDIIFRGEFLEGLMLSAEELRILYNILTLEEKEPFDIDEFNKFWDKFHYVTKLTKTDRESAIKYYKKLKKEERQKAYDKIWDYYNSIQDKRYLKKCRTYLADKNFNDEFVTNNVPSIGRSVSIEEVK